VHRGRRSHFLRQRMDWLAGEGIIHSKRGCRAGFQITVFPDRLFLRQVVNAVEGRFSLGAVSSALSRAMVLARAHWL